MGNYKSNIIRRINDRLMIGIYRNLPAILNRNSLDEKDRGPEYLEWLDNEMIAMVNEFVAQEKLLDSAFVKGLNRAFNTGNFNLLIKKWLVDYFSSLFALFDDKSDKPNRVITIEDNPVNQYAYNRYISKFNRPVKVNWLVNQGKISRLLSILFMNFKIVLSSLKNGIKISSSLKSYKVMREAIWGLYDKGLYFHDNFMIDGEKIKDQDLLLFSRGIPPFSLRLFAYNDAKRSPYAFFNLEKIKLSLKPLFLRIIPKYIIAGSDAISHEINSTNYSLYSTIYSYFYTKAIPYEKVFSNFKVGSELGQNYYSATHIPEAIICQNYRTKYYLMHWSDNSVRANIYISSFLACDKYFLWGKAHVQGSEGSNEIMYPIGYLFKNFIKEVVRDRAKIIKLICIPADSKVVSFFDETFGGDSGMLEAHHINIWQTALELARQREDITVVIKPKIDVKYFAEYSRYSKQGLNKFKKIYDEIRRCHNVFVISPAEWSFIEIIGISDVVITQGMTSSATIALICGKEGLYLHQANYMHPFIPLFKDQLVFNDPLKLIAMVEKILSGEESPKKAISEDLLREYDAYSDNKAIERFREILVGAV